jgi:hypothetical protein
MKKRFVKFFVTEMIPITRYENKMVKSGKNTYNTLSPFCGLFNITTLFLTRRSFKMDLLRRGKVVIPTKTINLVIYNSLAAISGICFGNYFKYELLYEHSLFMRERLLSELHNNIYREEVMIRNNGVLFEDYPYSHMEGMISDAELKRIKRANAKERNNQWIRTKDVMIGFIFNKKQDNQNTNDVNSLNLVDSLSNTDEKETKTINNNNKYTDDSNEKDI